MPEIWTYDSPEPAPEPSREVERCPMLWHYGTSKESCPLCGGTEKWPMKELDLAEPREPVERAQERANTWLADGRCAAVRQVDGARCVLGVGHEEAHATRAPKPVSEQRMRCRHGGDALQCPICGDSTHAMLAGQTEPVSEGVREQRIRLVFGYVSDRCTFEDDETAQCSTDYPDEPNEWCDGCVIRAFKPLASRVPGDGAATKEEEA